MNWRIVGRIVAILGILAGGCIGSGIAIALLSLKRVIYPPGPMMMGDLESAGIGMAGFGFGIAISSMLTAYGWRAFWPTKASSKMRRASKIDDSPQPTLDSYRYYVSFSAVAIVFFGGLAGYFAEWNGSNNWTIPLRFSSLMVDWLWVLIAIAPQLALVGLSWTVRSRRIEMRTIYAATALMISIMMYIHLPGKYQTGAGGIPSGSPNGMYPIAFIECCILQWGVWLTTAGIILGRRLAARRSLQRIDELQ